MVPRNGSLVWISAVALLALPALVSAVGENELRYRHTETTSAEVKVVLLGHDTKSQAQNIFEKGFYAEAAAWKIKVEPGRLVSFPQQFMPITPEEYSRLVENSKLKGIELGDYHLLGTINVFRAGKNVANSSRGWWPKSFQLQSGDLINLFEVIP